jgi:hypothetical protein
MTRPLVREGVPQRQDSNFQKTTFGQRVTYGHKSQSGIDTLTYWLTVSCNVTSNFELTLVSRIVNVLRLDGRPYIDHRAGVFSILTCSITYKRCRKKI